MRLIDADKLIDEMKKWYFDEEKQRAAEEDSSPMDLFTHLAITTVKSQPTAYNIGKVIKHLEEWTCKADINVGDGTILTRDVIASKTAIEIVEDGMKNDVSVIVELTYRHLINTFRQFIKDNEDDIVRIKKYPMQIDLINGLSVYFLTSHQYEIWCKGRTYYRDGIKYHSDYRLKEGVENEHKN